jgi:competence protein ComEA
MTHYLKPLIASALLLGTTYTATAVAADTMIKADLVAKASISQKLNINTATAEQLMSLPGIGKSKAKAIIDYREQQGPFKRIDDLVLVRGIGEKMLAKLSDKIALEP